MRRWFALVLIQWAALLPTAVSTHAEAEEPGELATLAVGEYGVKVQAPASWKLVVKAEEILAFGLAIPTDDPSQTAGVKARSVPHPKASMNSAPGSTAAPPASPHPDARWRAMRSAIAPIQISW